MRATPEPEYGSLLRKGRLAVCQCQARGRVAVVVGGAMSTQGDDNTVYKAKDHSRDAFN